MRNMNTAIIRHLIAKKYCEPEYATLFEVRNQTGFNRSEVRYADAISMSLWPSRGLHLNGFEIKMSRQDWIKELKNPAKAEEISAFCHFWWVVAPKDMIAVHELPQTWGLIEATEKGLKIKKQAPEQKASQITLTFLASLLRSASQSTPLKAQVDKAVQERIAGEVGARTLHHQRQIDRLESSLKAKSDAIKEFEEASGVTLRNYSAGAIGEAVDFVIKGGLEGVEKPLVRMEREAEALLLMVKGARAALGASEPELNLLS
jgi:hypothetical protein